MKTINDRLLAEVKRLARNCGIDPANRTLDEIEKEHDKLSDPRFCDQHDMRLREAIAKAKKAQ